MLTNDNIAHLGDVERGEGTIRRLITDRGFGFIRPARAHGTTRKDLFFHAAQVVGVRYEELREDDIVSYTGVYAQTPENSVLKRALAAVGRRSTPRGQRQASIGMPAAR